MGKTQILSKRQLFMIFIIIISFFSIIHLRKLVYTNIRSIQLNNFRLSHAIDEQASLIMEGKLTKDLELFPYNQSFVNQLVVLQLERNATDEAYNSIEGNDQTIDHLIHIAHSLEKSKKYVEAESWYQHAINNDTSFGDPWYLLGRNLESQKKYPKAVSAYYQGLDLPKKRQTSANDFHLRLALISVKDPNFVKTHEGLKHIDMALLDPTFRKDSDKVQAHFARGELLRTLGRKEDAMAEYLWVIDTDKEHFWARIHLGYLKWEIEKDFDTAEALFLQASKIYENNKWPFKGLAHINAQAGNRQDARRMYEEVLLRDPNDKSGISFLSEP